MSQVLFEGQVRTWLVGLGRSPVSLRHHANAVPREVAIRLLWFPVSHGYPGSGIRVGVAPVSHGYPVGGIRGGLAPVSHGCPVGGIRVGLAPVSHGDPVRGFSVDLVTS